jgi:hypothetical protein
MSNLGLEAALVYAGLLTGQAVLLYLARRLIRFAWSKGEEAVTDAVDRLEDRLMLRATESDMKMLERMDLTDELVDQSIKQLASIDTTVAALALRVDAINGRLRFAEGFIAGRQPPPLGEENV